MGDATVPKENGVGLVCVCVCELLKLLVLYLRGFTNQVAATWLVRPRGLRPPMRATGCTGQSRPGGDHDQEANVERASKDVGLAALHLSPPLCPLSFSKRL